MARAFFSGRCYIVGKQVGKTEDGRERVVNYFRCARAGGERARGYEFRELHHFALCKRFKFSSNRLFGACQKPGAVLIGQVGAKKNEQGPSEPKRIKVAMKAEIAPTSGSREPSEAYRSSKMGRKSPRPWQSAPGQTLFSEWSPHRSQWHFQKEYPTCPDIG